MSIVAPISATGVALPVIVGIATGTALAARLAGPGVTVVGVLLASREQQDGRRAGGRRPRRRSWLALVAALGFGSYFVLRDVAADASVLWLLALSRVLSSPALIALIAFVRRAPAAGARRRPLALALAGRSTSARPGSTAWPTRTGALSIVVGRRLAVPGDDDPAGARGARRAHPPRAARGVAAALLGVAMIAAG